MKQVKIFTSSIRAASIMEKEVNDFIKNKNVIQTETKINSAGDIRYNVGSEIVIIIVYEVN